MTDFLFLSVCFDLGTRNKLGACPGVVCGGFLRTLAGRIGRILCSFSVGSPAVLPVVHSVYCACIVGLALALREY